MWRDGRSGLSAACGDQRDALFLVGAEHLLQPPETVDPAVFVERKAFLCGELALRQEDLGPLTSILERKLDYRLPVVRIGGIPPKRVRQTGGRIDLPELAREVEEVAIRRLHRDPVAASDARIELNAGSGEASGAPPLREFPRVAQRPVYGRPRARQDPLQAQHRSVACRHLTPLPRIAGPLRRRREDVLAGDLPDQIGVSLGDVALHVRQQLVGVRAADDDPIPLTLELRGHRHSLLSLGE